LSLDQGDKGVQCGKKIDILKFWFYLKGNGWDKISTDVDICISNARYMASELKRRKNFELIWDPQFVNVCFYYVPDGLLGLERTPKVLEKLHHVAPFIKQKLTESAKLLIGFSTTKG